VGFHDIATPVLVVAGMSQRAKGGLRAADYIGSRRDTDRTVTIKKKFLYFFIKTWIRWKPKRCWKSKDRLSNFVEHILYQTDGLRNIYTERTILLKLSKNLARYRYVKILLDQQNIQKTQAIMSNGIFWYFSNQLELHNYFDSLTNI